MKLVKAGMGEILFPYASSHVKQSYHQTMNAKMCNEVRDVLTKVRFTFNHHIAESKHTLHLTFGELSPLNYQVRKAIDYLKLFDEVNNELIEDDRVKKEKGKKTNRFEITPIFVEATELIGNILRHMREFKIKSISQEQPYSFYDYFYEMDKDEQQKLDSVKKEDMTEEQLEQILPVLRDAQKFYAFPILT